MATDYTYLYEEYPEVISADQLYRICHISKRKAKWLLEHGYIPCEDSGKKTRRYKIRLNDVIDYLLTLEAAPDLVATPVGAFNVKRKQLNPVAQICQKGFQRFLYNIWTDEADILRISDVQVLLGYSAGTIRQWILRKELRSTRLPCGIQVTAKEWLIDFKAYQFIIYDCGVMQTPTSIFRDAEHRLLCGSVLPYEIPVFHKALSECGSLEVRPVAICVPQEIQEYCTELFGEDVQIAAASHDLFAKQVNGQIYRPLVEKYIAGEKRL